MMQLQLLGAVELPLGAGSTRGASNHVGQLQVNPGVLLLGGVQQPRQHLHWQSLA